MTPPLLKKAAALSKSPARDFVNTLYRIRSWVLAGIAASVMAATKGVLWSLLSFVMEPDLLAFLFKPLSMVMPLLAAMLAGLMAFDFSKLDQMSFRLKKHKHLKNPDTNVQPQTARPA